MLFVANADANNLAVFNVADRAAARPLGFIPVGWYPTSVRYLPATKIILIGLHVFGGRFFQRAPLVLTQNHAQRANDVPGNFILDPEDVLELSIVPLRPKMVTITYVDQLSGDSQSISRLTHAAFKNGLYF